jgi:hypothetical protein
MHSLDELINEQLYYTLSDQDQKTAKDVTDLLLSIKEILIDNYKRINPKYNFEKYLQIVFEPRTQNGELIPELLDRNINIIIEKLYYKGISAELVEMSGDDVSPHYVIHLTKIKLFDQETKKGIDADIYFSPKVSETNADADVINKHVTFYSRIMNYSDLDMYGIVYHEFIHMTQPTKKLSRRYIAAIRPRTSDYTPLMDWYNYMRAHIEFEAQLGGSIEVIRDRFFTLYEKASNNELWQRTRNIQLNNIKKISELNRKEVLREFSINYTEENSMPYDNSIIPSNDINLLTLIYYSSIGDDKMNNNVGRLRWNQLINAFKHLYKYLSELKDYETK